MTEHNDPLETRLRHALGTSGPLGEAGGGALPGAARGRVLGDLRRRRLHRMQVAGGCGALVLAAAVAVPVAVGAGGRPAGRAPGTTGAAHASDAAPAPSPAAGGAAGGAAGVAHSAGGAPSGTGDSTAPPGSASGQCVVDGAPAVACGEVVSPTRYSTFPVMPPTQLHASIPSSLSAATGASLTVTLPPAPPGTQWGTPSVSDSAPASPGGTPVLAVARSGASVTVGTWAVAARHPGSAVLRVAAVADRCAGSAGCPSTSEWSLLVVVTGQ